MARSSGLSAMLISALGLLLDAQVTQVGGQVLEHRFVQEKGRGAEAREEGGALALTGQWGLIIVKEDQKERPQHSLIMGRKGSKKWEHAPKLS